MRPQKHLKARVKNCYHKTMANIDVKRAGDSGEDFAFDVAVDSHSYRVTLTRDYYQKLTGGKVAPEQLVRASFEFLLARERPESILSEFDLPLIGHYFPEYEQAIKK